MFNSPIRRAQLIAPFGVGALLMTKEGVSIIGAGLDHWFDEGDDQRQELDCEEFYIEEWRLQRSLDVDFFQLPPDFRPRTRYGPNINTRLTIPYLRFPTWHFLPEMWAHGRVSADRTRAQDVQLRDEGGRWCRCRSWLSATAAISKISLGVSGFTVQRAPIAPASSNSRALARAACAGL